MNYSDLKIDNLNLIKEKAIEISEKLPRRSFLIPILMEFENETDIKHVYCYGDLSLVDFCILFNLYIYIPEILDRSGKTDFFKYLKDEDIILHLLGKGYKSDDFSLYYLDFETKEIKIRSPWIVSAFLDGNPTINDEMIVRAYKYGDKELYSILRNYESSEFIHKLMGEHLKVEGEKIILNEKIYTFDKFIESFSEGYGLFLKNYLEVRQGDNHCILLK